MAERHRGAQDSADGRVRIEKILSDDVEVSVWVGEGLPADELSVQNGVLTTRASRFPLCIDPQMQAVGWIKSRRRGPQGAHLQRRRLYQAAGVAITYEQPFLFEGVEEFIDGY